MRRLPGPRSVREGISESVEEAPQFPEVECTNLFDQISRGTWIVLFAQRGSQLTRTAADHLITFVASAHLSCDVETCLTYIDERCACLFQIVRLPQLRLYVGGNEVMSVRGVPARKDLDRIVAKLDDMG